MASSPRSSPSPQAGQHPPSSGDAEPASPAALALGTAGLIPFWAAALAYAFGPPQLAGPALLALLAYSAAILSFLGGARWGMEIAARRPPRASVLALSSLPALAAWVLLAGTGGLGLTEVHALGGFLLAFAIQGLWDARASDAPRWHRGLRVWLTVGACGALATALGATLTV
jgi:hypothetical protein